MEIEVARFSHAGASNTKETCGHDRACQTHRHCLRNRRVGGRIAPTWLSGWLPGPEPNRHRSGDLRIEVRILPGQVHRQRLRETPAIRNGLPNWSRTSAGGSDLQR